LKRTGEYNLAIARKAGLEYMRIKVLAVLLILFCTHSLSAQKKIKPERICITEQEAEVYKSLGAMEYVNDTTIYPLTDWVTNQIPDIAPDLIIDFNQKNDKTYSLRCITKKDGKEKKLKNTYGENASRSFSRIGFSKDGNQALYYYSWSGVGNTCGSEFIYLKRDNDRWKIEKRLTQVICWVLPMVLAGFRAV
jgi:hypothetical protein